jgi:hypothetical protein
MALVPLRDPRAVMHQADQDKIETVVGVADLVGTLRKLSLSDLRANIAKHQVSSSDIDNEFEHNTAWVLRRAEQLRQPVPSRHPAGAVIWVKLAPDVPAMSSGN